MGSGTSNLWVVGDGGVILKWTGGTWATEVSGTIQGLAGIWGTDAHNVWVVGTGGTILHYLPN